MDKIEINLNALPGHIGKDNGGRIDYRYTDVPAIQHWIKEQIGSRKNVEFTVTGIMPTWLAFDIAVFLYECQKVEKFLYITPYMKENSRSPYVIFPKVI